VHHIHPKADGGGSEPDDLVLLCGVHHRSVHRGFLIIEGKPSTGLRFLHADGTSYGGRVCSVRTGVLSTAYEALKRMGFRESDVRKALDEVRTHAGRVGGDGDGPRLTHVGQHGGDQGGALDTHMDQEPPLEQVLQAALAVLCP
jgi:hypothetical protein